MNKIFPLLTASFFVIGCSSTQSVSNFAPAERDLVAKAQYYEDLNQRHYRDNINAVAEIDAKLERAPAEAETLLQEQGWSKAEYKTLISGIRGDDELNQAFEEARLVAEAARQ